MSLDQIFNKEFARRNLWEAMLFDHDHNPLLWSKGLIKSTNIPKLQFTIEDIYAGSSKGYLGWKLPDNLSLTIWETSDHQVEKYLDEWMVGKTGVLNPNDDSNGVRFRVQPENYLYRDVQIKTFIYQYVAGKPYGVKRQEHTRVQNVPYVEEKQYMPKDYKKQGKSQEITLKKLNHPLINPPSLTGLPNVPKISLPSSLPKISIPPLGTPSLNAPSFPKISFPTMPKESSMDTITLPIFPFPPEDNSTLIQKPVLPEVTPPELLCIPVSTGSPQPYSVPSDIVEEISLLGGETTHAKQWTAIEKITSIVTYSTAIEGYDIGTYDYTTGDGVSYTVNLAIRDIKIEYPV